MLNIKPFFLLSVAFLTLSLSAFSQSKKKKKNKALEVPVLVQDSMRNTLDSISYSVGVGIVSMLKDQGFDSISFKWFEKAFLDHYQQKTLLINEEAGNMGVREYLQKMKEEKAAKQKAAGETFLTENKAKEGVVTLPSGLQYLVLEAGNGAIPTLQNKVKVHYHGTLIDGTVFDSSVERGEPISFPVSGVIKGWVEALQLMPVGSKWRLFIPYQLAYGDRQAGAKITPYSTLIFDVTLLGIE
jgi:FKBP-type peptidyl-prolyl cis-trans isomerase FklB